MEAIELQNVSKTFGGIAALSDLNLGIRPGELTALLGPNGAGKTTAISLMLGLAAPTRGQVRVLGAAPGSAAAREGTAYLPENLAFHPALTGREQIRAYLALRGAPGISALAGDTDGTDGGAGSATDPAGARIDETTLERARSLGLDPAHFLSDNDSTGFFTRIGDLIETGPTCTNVNDFRAIVVDSP